MCIAFRHASFMFASATHPAANLSPAYRVGVALYLASTLATGLSPGYVVVVLAQHGHGEGHLQVATARCNYLDPFCHCLHRRRCVLCPANCADCICAIVSGSFSLVPVPGYHVQLVCYLQCARSTMAFAGMYAQACLMDAC